MCRTATAIVTLFLCAGTLFGRPQPGDIWREYISDRNYGANFGWFVNNAGIDTGPGSDGDTLIVLAEDVDLTGAVRAEVEVQKALVDGNSGVRVQFNDGAWVNLPDAPVSNWNSYQHHHYPVAPLPLSELRQGRNLYRLKTINSTSRYLQIYGVQVRVYYGADIPHPTGAMLTPASNAELGEQVSLTCQASSPNGTIRRVEYIGLYEDVNYMGDGVYRQWQGHHYRRFFIHNLGSVPRPPRTTPAPTAPFAVVWNTEWVPDQPEPMRIAARIIDETGMVFMTQPSTGLVFNRPGLAVELCKPYDIPQRWLVRTGTKAVKFDVTGDLDQADSARFYVSTWNGEDSRGFRINGTPLQNVPNLVGAHGYGFQISPIHPISCLRSGQNAFEALGGADAHGMEIQYPSFMPVIQYRDPDVAAERRARAAGTRQPTVSITPLPHAIAVVGVHGPAMVEVFAVSGELLYSGSTVGDVAIPMEHLKKGASVVVVTGSSTRTAQRVVIR
ncbi:MAG: hypothetical protein GF331_05460 [Chitinivibrionales bacterium]|nr:hypothetical protein [Chitinivibrionales bacterium]